MARFFVLRSGPIRSSNSPDTTAALLCFRDHIKKCLHSLVGVIVGWDYNCNNDTNLFCVIYERTNNNESGSWELYFVRVALRVQHKNTQLLCYWVLLGYISHLAINTDLLLWPSAGPGAGALWNSQSPRLCSFSSCLVSISHRWALETIVRLVVRCTVGKDP